MPELKKNTVLKDGSDRQNGLIRILNLLLSKYFKAFIFVLVSAVFLSGYLFIIKPKYEAIAKGVEEKTKMKQAEYDDLNSYFIKLQRYLASYGSISEENKNLINEMIPAGGAPEKFFTSLGSLIQGRGLILSSLDISPDIKKTKKDAAVAAASSEIGKIKIVLNIVGTDYAGLKDLLATIENNLNLMDVEKVDWKPGTRSALIEITTYYLN